jgi:hypothetical protein
MKTHYSLKWLVDSAFRSISARAFTISSLASFFLLPTGTCVLATESIRYRRWVVHGCRTVVVHRLLEWLPAGLE